MVVFTSIANMKYVSPIWKIACNSYDEVSSILIRRNTEHHPTLPAPQLHSRKTSFSETQKEEVSLPTLMILATLPCSDSFMADSGILRSYIDYPQCYAALSQQRETQVETGSVRPKARTGSKVECITATLGRTSQLESERWVVGRKLKYVPTHLYGGSKSSYLVRIREDRHGAGHLSGTVST